MHFYWGNLENLGGFAVATVFVIVIWAWAVLHFYGQIAHKRRRRARQGDYLVRERFWNFTLWVRRLLSYSNFPRLTDQRLKR